MMDKKIIPLFLIIALGMGFAVGFYWPREKEVVLVPGESGGGLFGLEPVDWTNPEKPMSSTPLEESEIPQSAVRINVSTDGFSPTTFEAERGQKVVLAVTAADKWNHIFRFKDEILSAVAVGVADGDTRAITFYAPKEPGSYQFHCAILGHEGRGEKGAMIVK